MTIPFALLGAGALWLTYAWLASAIVSATFGNTAMISSFVMLMLLLLMIRSLIR